MRDTLDGAHQVFVAHDHELVVVPRQHGLIVRELARELATGEHAAPDAKEQGLLVIGKVDLFGLGIRQQPVQLGKSLARDQRLLLAGEPFEVLVQLLNMRQAMAVRRNHGHGLGLEYQQRAVQRVARLLIRNRKDDLGDHVAQRGRVDLVPDALRELRDLREVCAGHADHLRVGSACTDLHPVVVHQLDADVALR